METAVAEAGAVGATGQVAWTASSGAAGTADGTTDGRRFIVGGNWKMNTVAETARGIVASLNGTELDPATEVFVAPPAVLLAQVRGQLRREIAVAAQNVFDRPQGAFTGEIATDMVRDAGATWVIVGHSERRTLLGESNEFVARKVKYALAEGLEVCLCVGEDLQTREAGQTVAFVVTQLAAVLKAGVNDWTHIVVAYEPIWAIGTGRVATPEQAQEVHAAIRAWIRESLSERAAQTTRILYGGSVSAKNCGTLARSPDIDGFLVGGASLKPEFISIINAKRDAQS